MTVRRRGLPPAVRWRWRTSGLLALGAGAALALASCSSPGTGRSTSSATSTTGGHTTTTTTTTGGSSTTTSAPSTTTVGTANCQPTQLAAAAGRGTGAAGTLVLTINLTNTSTTTCSLYGYPGLQLLDAGGGAITTTVVRGQFHFPTPAANQPPANVRLVPGAAVTFSLAYGDVPVGNETSCATSSQVEITPPNDATHLVMPLQIGPCDNGTVHVSPVYAAS